MEIKFKKLDPRATAPQKGYPDDAAFDLFALEETVVGAKSSAWIKTGIAFEIPEGYAGLIWDKSSVAHKWNITKIGGVFDAGYRGDITIGLHNLSDESHIFKAGDKIAQIIFTPAPPFELKEADTLSESVRGEKRFGSSGLRI